VTRDERRPWQGAASRTTTTAIDEIVTTDLSALLAAAAIEYARHNWPVFPLRGKVPAIPKPHRKGSPERQTCKGECGQFGHGSLDASTDVETITRWWSRYVAANIGGRVPINVLVLDIDPRHGGLDTLASLDREHGKLPDCLTTMSGRGDGGKHLFYRRPPGRLSAQLGPGIDVKVSPGYVVLPPSIHPDTRKPYTRIDGPIPNPPTWLTALIVVKPPPPTRGRPVRVFSARGFSGVSIADQFSAETSWTEVLEPHGWTCLDADPDADGARWLHPAATSKCSATVRYGCLFVYSPNTVFEVTEPGNRHGYTRFKAYARLNHNGDMRAAAQSLKGGGRA
jgi:hypothetical protein